MYTYNIDVLRVIDGDTIDASIDLGFDVKIKNHSLYFFGEKNKKHKKNSQRLGANP